MKMTDEDDDLHPEYDSRELLNGAARGKYAARARESRRKQEKADGDDCARGGSARRRER
jgi:hypothetical protein